MISDDMINDRIDEILEEKENHHFELFDIIYFFKNSEMTIQTIDDVDEYIIYIDDKITSIINDINNDNEKRKRRINYKDINRWLIDLKINLKTRSNKEIIAIILNHITYIEEKEKKIQKKIRENYCKICIAIIIVMMLIAMIITIAILF